MARTATRAIEAARVADARLAWRDTPFLFDHWYVAGLAEDFSRILKPRTILGRPLVLYRTRAGAPVALSDRCVHRSFPLSRSRLEGDTIVCGYHGMRYAADGRCTEIPAQQSEPRGIGVRAYPLREQGPLVWIWMGEGDPAADLPLGDWATDPDWPSSNAAFHLKASYIALHENLLDLTHLSYLHADTFGTPDYAFAPYSVEADDANGRFAILRSVMPTRLPPVWARPSGLEGRDAARIARSEFRGPSLHTVTVRMYAMDTPEAERPDLRIATAHLATPETATSTHYFIHHGRNFGQDDPSITGFMHDQLVAAFREDVEGLEAVEEAIAQTPPADRYEISVAADRAGLAMRRWILREAERERSRSC